MAAAFRRHVVGKTQRPLCYCDIAYMRFVGKLMIIWAFSYTKLIQLISE